MYSGIATSGIYSLARDFATSEGLFASQPILSAQLVPTWLLAVPVDDS